MPQVALDRITRAIYGATANEQFPGCIVVAETVNSWRYSDTLVIWNPAKASGNAGDLAANATGLPLYRELVIYCPHPTYPSQLVEITAPGNAGTVPAVTDTSTWLTQIAAIKINARVEDRDAYQPIAALSDRHGNRLGIARGGAIRDASAAIAR